MARLYCMTLSKLLTESFSSWAHIFGTDYTNTPAEVNINVLILQHCKWGTILGAHIFRWVKFNGRVVCRTANVFSSTAESLITSNQPATSSFTAATLWTGLWGFKSQFNAAVDGISSSFQLVSDALMRTLWATSTIMDILWSTWITFVCRSKNP